MWQLVVIFVHLFIDFIIQVQFLVTGLIILVHLLYHKMTALIIAFCYHVGSLTVEAWVQPQAT
jgi:hypothetical protein